ncbi:MAG: general secretion pathway protein GspB, partial [Woeseiaceae bacterium]
QPVAAPGLAADEPPTGSAAAGKQEPAPRQTAPVVADGLPAFDDLRAAGMLSLPDLHLDIHVYSATPAERFVFVNMNKYRENATLAEGPLLREITPDGVILDYRGTTFLLPRE